ncbi:HIR2 [Cyberlindnera jadinii]|uniref:Protein HIR n=1 Tax=Cyberlindnera jadinii (strain ATCC 18201 / CBS 1600 / BCRC 20928 / JCM 3617 / NBRC 0987 / NRRL Y-1542) TaxID=983966 RepID=A0A0H5CA99_CYBJN|nr:HIR2 [Cyberlindnera jadinii]
MRLLKVPGSVPVTALVYSDGLLFAAQRDGVVSVWDAKKLCEVANMSSISQGEKDELNPLSTLAVHDGVEVTCITVLGDEIITGDAEGKVYKTRVTAQHELTGVKLLMDHKGKQINDVTRSGQLVLFGLLNQVAAYDMKEDKQLPSIMTRTDIKSVSVDPTGVYLVTVGANKNVSLYQIQVSDGTFLHKKITVASQSLTSIVDVCRISWSPSGERFALPNTNLDPNAKTIGMISRSNWKSDFSLIGQNANVVSFCSKVFTTDDSKHYNVIASSGVNKAITVWNTSFQRPLFTAADVSSKLITDIQWSTDGLSMFVAGDTIVVFVFETEELGKPIDEETFKGLISKLKIPEPLKPKEETSTLTLKPLKSNTVIEEIPKDVETPEPAKLESKSISLLKGDRKRIAPTLISSKDNKKGPLQPQISKSPTENGSQRTMEFDLPSFSVPKDLKRREESETPESDQPAIKKRRDLEPIEFIGNIAINPSTAFSKIRISTPKIRSSFVLESPNDPTLALEIKNGSGSEQKPTKITLLRNYSKQIFTDFIPKLVCLASGGEGGFWAVSTVDGVLYIYSDSGRRIFPPLVLGTPLSFLESKGKFLLAVTSLGEVYTWNVQSKKALFEPTSLYPLLARSNTELLTRAENLTMCSISSSGVPVVTLSNGNGYLFDKDLETWTLISDSWWAFGSQYWDSGDVKPTGSLISVLEKKTNDEIVRRGRAKFLQKMAKTMLMKEGYENLEKIVSLAHLENRILISLRLGESIEFKTHLIIYCKRISEMGFKARLAEIFEELLSQEDMDTSESNSKILDFDKHELLKELIFACAGFRNVQRILVQYATAMNILDRVVF